MKLILNPDVEINRNAQSPSPFFVVANIEKFDGSRGADNREFVELEDYDIVELELEDGNIWIGPAIDFIQLSQSDYNIIANRGGEEGYSISSKIKIENNSRGAIDWIKVNLFSFFRKQAQEWLAGEVVQRVAAKFDKKNIAKPGIYTVDNRLQLSYLKEKSIQTSDSILLFIHGTASSFDGSFGKIDDGDSKELYNYCFQNFPSRVFAYEHHTLSQNPIQNAIDLISQLPRNAKVQLITHSRGGLIGEVLSLYHSENATKGFDDYHFEILKDNEAMQGQAKELNNLMADRSITIEKFVRVACPSEGTSLCTERLDRFVNILLNGTKLIAPGASALIDILKEIVQSILACKDESDILPGIEVMNPESPFVKVLNYSQHVINAPLHIVAGNAAITPSWRALITLVSKAIFYDANDWIVDTDYMNGGVVRNKPVLIYNYRSGEINHFRYFLNQDTSNAIVRSLQSSLNQVPEGFEVLDMKAGEGTRGWITGRYKGEVNKGNRSKVIIIPGILGSNLHIQNEDGSTEEVYLNLGQISLGGMKKLAIGKHNVVPESVVGSAYKQFGKYLFEDYDVDVFPFDWRIEISKEAKRLADVLTKALKDLPANASLKIVAHSMGGLVVRHLIMNHNAVWAQVKQREGFRVLFLGTPFYGSYAIPGVLIGQDDRLKELALLDTTNNRSDLLEDFANYPGILSLLPIDPENSGRFKLKSTWAEIQKVSTRFKVTIPNLDAIATYFSEVDTFDSKFSFEFDNPNIHYIAGTDKRTPNKMIVHQWGNRRGGVEFEDTPEGDGRVTWRLGIPRNFKEQDRVYYVPVTHGKLADDKGIFPGLKEILDTNTTSQLSKSPVEPRKGLFDRILGRGSVKARTSEDLANLLLECGDRYDYQKEQSSLGPITVKLKCGDLTYAKHPILLGHIDDNSIWGAEAVVDKLLDGALTMRIKLGVYPSAAGESTLVEQHGKVRAIIASFGSDNVISENVVQRSLESALLKYCIYRREQQPSNSEFLNLSISSILVGSGYVGLSIYKAVDILIAAIDNVNQKLEINSIKARIAELELHEIFEDKAVEAYRTIRKLTSERPGYISFYQTDLLYSEGYRTRIVKENVNEWWLRIGARIADNRPISNENLLLLYTSSEGMARVRSEYSEINLGSLTPILEEMSQNNKWSDELGLAIYRLLVPYSFREEFSKQNNILLTLDAYTASFPWELILDRVKDSKPVSVKNRFIRKFETDTYRARVNHCIAMRAFVVGDPELDKWDQFKQLPGAEREARIVADCLTTGGFQTTSLIRKSARDILVKLHSGNYRIIHIAAHGLYDEQDGSRTGIVIGKNKFIRVSDIKKLDEVPELVFINCCYSGTINTDDDIQNLQRYKLSANIGLELIRIGVKAVVVTGWAVDDAAAYDFAKDFYAKMLEGETFAGALLKARKNCYEKYSHTNTWGTYQAYGDENYQLIERSDTKEKKKEDYILRSELEVELRNMLFIKSFSLSEEKRFERLRYLESLLMNLTNVSSEIFQLFAENYSKLRKIDDALRMIALAKSRGDGDYSLKMLQLNFQLRIKKSLLQPPTAATLNEVESILGEIETLAKIQENYSLLAIKASAFKTKAYIQTVLNETVTKITTSIQASFDAYQKCLEKKSEQPEKVFFARMNSAQMSVVIDELNQKVLNAADKKLRKKQEQELRNAIALEKEKISDPTRYWDRIIVANLQLTLFLLNGNKSHLGEMLNEIQKLWRIDGDTDKKQIEIDHVRILKTLLHSNENYNNELTKVLETLEEYKRGQF
jgi:hypothetical protein